MALKIIGGIENTVSRIPERDWKRLHALKDEKLGKVCENILAEIEEILKKREGKEHESYLGNLEVTKKRG